jgi:hypothetical protein
MKRHLIQAAFIAASLLLSAGLSCAADSNAVAPEDTKAIKAPKATEKSTKAKNAKPAAKVKLVDINSAGKKELMTLPGIKEAEAEKIIAGRPYLSKAHLVTHDVLSQAAYMGISERVIAKQNKATAAKLLEMQKGR